jgi:hypothetical protein
VLLLKRRGDRTCKRQTDPGTGKGPKTRRHLRHIQLTTFSLLLPAHACISPSSRIHSLQSALYYDFFSLILPRLYQLILLYPARYLRHLIGESNARYASTTRRSAGASVAISRQGSRSLPKPSPGLQFASPGIVLYQCQTCRLREAVHATCRLLSVARKQVIPPTNRIVQATTCPQVLPRSIRLSNRSHIGYLCGR